MRESNRTVDLKTLFPFSLCDDQLVNKASKLGKCVKYESGESVLLSGSPAKHCGIITEGQAVAFKKDSDGKRYQLCLEKGCFVGLETIEPNQKYSAKIVAVTGLEVFFWNAEGLTQLQEADTHFAEALHILNDGRIYQETSLIPETDVTDPVLCSRTFHWLSNSIPAFMILPVLFILLWTCALLIRRYPVVWLFVFALFAAAGKLLYDGISHRLSERLIATTKNVILIPQKQENEPVIMRMSQLNSVSVKQNLSGRIFDFGKIRVQTDDQDVSTRMIRHPGVIGALIHNYAELASSGRPVAFHAENLLHSHTTSNAAEQKAFSAAENPRKSIPFRTIEFHAHWALLVKMIIKPLLLICVALSVSCLYKNPQYIRDVCKISLIAAAIGIIGVIYQFMSWRNHRFLIEKDCIRDCSKKPLLKEGQNMAMIPKIQSVRFQKDGFFQAMLNYGTVYILAGEAELTFDYVSNPRQVQQQIMDVCSQYESDRFLDEQYRHREYISGLFSDLQQEHTAADPHQS